MSLILVVSSVGILSSIPSPVAYWKLRETSGTRVDSIGSNNLTDNNTVTQSAGKVGDAAQFTAATNEYLSIADNAALSIGATDAAWDMWVYMDSLGVDRRFLSKSASAPDREYYIAIGIDDQVSLVAFFGGVLKSVTATTFGALSSATWYYVYAEFNSTGQALGISINNGALDTATTGSATLDDAAAQFILGSLNGTGEFMNGRIDEVGFWKQRLSAAARTARYNNNNGNTVPF